MTTWQFNEEILKLKKPGKTLGFLSTSDLQKMTGLTIGQLRRLKLSGRIQPILESTKMRKSLYAPGVLLTIAKLKERLIVSCHLSVKEAGRGEGAAPASDGKSIKKG